MTPLVFRILFLNEKSGVDEVEEGNFGKIYAFNLIGSAIGPFLTGFLLIELLGISGSLRLMAYLNLLIGGGILFIYFYYQTKKVQWKVNYLL